MSQASTLGIALALWLSELPSLHETAWLHSGAFPSIASVVFSFDRDGDLFEIDRASRQILRAGNDPVPLPDGAQGRLSVLVQLGLLARAMPERFAKGAVVQLPEITVSRVEQTGYTVRGDAVLQTEAGPLRTLHLERTAPPARHDARIEVWLGYDHGMLPVRLRVADTGGRVLDQILVR